MQFYGGYPFTDCHWFQDLSKILLKEQSLNFASALGNCRGFCQGKNGFSLFASAIKLPKQLKKKIDFTFFPNLQNLH